MANRNFANSRMYTGHVMPVLLDVSIPIGSTGAVGTIAGPYIKAVTRLGVGTYQVQMQDNYSGYYLGQSQFISPVSGSDLSIRAADTALTIGKTYVITILGAATAANWTTLGVPTGVTAAVGVAFVALATGAGTNAVSKVKLLGDSGIAKVELCSNPNTSIAPVGANTSGAQGAIVLLQCMGPSITVGAYTPIGTISRGNIPVATGTAGDAVTNNAGTLNSTGGQDLTVDLQTFTGSAASLTATLAYIPVDPASGSTLKLSFMFSNSSVLIGGE